MKGGVYSPTQDIHAFNAAAFDRNMSSDGLRGNNLGSVLRYACSLLNSGLILAIRVRWR